MILPDSHTSAQDGQQKKQPPTPVVNTHHLMELFNRPLYSYLKKAMQEKPQSEEGWKTIHERGLQAAEVANLVALRQVPKDHEQWIQFAADLQRAGVNLAEAAKSEEIPIQPCEASLGVRQAVARLTSGQALSTSQATWRKAN